MVDNAIRIDWADWAALTWFFLVWGAFTLLTDGRRLSRPSMTSLMNRNRARWLRVMAIRELRMIDTSIMLGLQQGTAFFASASIFALGGCFALLGASDHVFQVFRDLPFAANATRATIEMKILGLAAIFAYSFFKFGWSYRLFNYCSILIGAVPPANHREDDTGGFERAVHVAIRFNTLAGKHFNSGLRAIFFSIGYLGWLVGPLAFMISTSLVLAVLVRRQFFSGARLALLEAEKGARSGGGE